MYIDIKRIMMTVKVEDGHIILEKPLPIEKYGKKFKIRQINWYYKWDKFSLWLGIFLNHYLNVCNALNVFPEVPDKLEDLEKFRKNIRMTIRNQVKYKNRIFNKWVGKLAFVYLRRLCKIGTGLKTSWMKRNFDLDDWIEIFVYVYLYNVMGVKKNLLNVSRVIKQVVSN